MDTFRETLVSAQNFFLKKLKIKIWEIETQMPKERQSQNCKDCIKKAKVRNNPTATQKDFSRNKRKGKVVP